jgi:glycosyltransferase involved in cell wall biosynthesis
MKVALVCPRFTPYVGGVETHVRMIAERLLRFGLKVEVLTTDSSGCLPKEENINGVRIKRFKSLAPSESYYFSRTLWSYLNRKSEQYDVVHAHAYHDFPALFAALSKRRNKLVFTPHYHGVGHTPFRRLIHIPYKSLGKITFKRADIVLCVSEFERRLVASSFKVPISKLTIIPNGVVLSDFQGLVSSRNRTKTILCVGGIEEYKRVDVLIRSLKYMDREISLEIVGKGGTKNQLLRLTSELGLNDRVRYYENLPRNELLQKYASASVFASVSRLEAFGISVAESLAAGTPCAVANSTALSEWVDGKNCLGIDDPDNPRKVADIVIQAMGLHVNLPEGRLKDWGEITALTLKVYEKLQHS